MPASASSLPRPRAPAARAASEAREQHRGGAVAGGVDDPDAPHGVVGGLGVGPVGVAGGDGRDGGGEPGAEQQVGGRLGVLAAEPVEQHRARPGPHGDQDQQRMHGMAEPGAGQGLVDLRRALEVADELRDGLGGAVDGLERAEPLEEVVADRRARRHVRGSTRATLPAMPLVITEQHGPVRHVVLNRPEKRNAFNGELIAAVGDALRAAAADTASHCVVIRGAGPMFSSGMDLGSLGELAENPDNLRAFRKVILDAWNLCEEMAKPTICVIHGACIGGAMELALACDLRVMAKDAVIGMPETRIGLIPDVGGSSRLPQVIGLGRAKEMVMTGKMINGDEAERIGLVNRTAHDRQARPGDAEADRRAAGLRAGRGRPRQARDGRLGAARRWRRRSSSRSRCRSCARARRTSPRAPRRSRRSASRSSAAAVTRPRTSPRSAPRSTTSSPSSRNVRVVPSASSSGSAPFQVSSMNEPRCVLAPARRSCRRRAGRRCAAPRR